MKQILATIGLTASLVLMNIAPIYAATGEFTIYPTYEHKNNKSWILLDLEAGEKTTDSVTIENLTDEMQTLNIQVLEGEEKEGSFLLNENENFEHIGSWTNIEHRTVTLSAHEKKQIPIEISIPRNAKKTQYKASILASKTEINYQNIAITTRIGVRMYLQVLEPGAMQTNIFNSSLYISSTFFFLSLMGVLGALIYNLIHHIENQKYAKKQA